MPGPIVAAKWSTCATHTSAPILNGESITVRVTFTPGSMQVRVHADAQPPSGMRSPTGKAKVEGVRPVAVIGWEEATASPPCSVGAAAAAATATAPAATAAHAARTYHRQSRCQHPEEPLGASGVAIDCRRLGPCERAPRCGEGAAPTVPVARAGVGHGGNNRRHVGGCHKGQTTREEVRPVAGLGLMKISGRSYERCGPMPALASMRGSTL